ncbi:MAG: hypothetical protein IJJ99_06895 [Oscillospiraceae bacterium]|nr:hypothetical protein [Oscillospiraceae bacterium]
MNRIKLLCLFLLPALLCLFLLPAAALTPDLSRTGSIRLTMRYEGQPVGGGELTIYRVAGIRTENGYSFAPVSGLESFDFSAAALERPELASEVLAEVEKVGLTGYTEQIGADGVVRFDDLTLGLYLIEQKVSAPGFGCIRPFFVCLPMAEDGELIYDVDASPKPFPMEPQPTEPTTPTDPTTPTEPSHPTEPTDPTVPDETLPQTGQLKWPVPVLGIGGTLCLLAGLLVLLCMRKERD